jgi:hypothetical protein
MYILLVVRRTTPCVIWIRRDWRYASPPTFLKFIELDGFDMAKRKKVVPVTAASTRRIIREELGKIDLPGTNISNCVFRGVEFDKTAVEAVTVIAEGLQANALALGNLARVFSNSNISMEAMLKVTGSGASIMGNHADMGGLGFKGGE